MELLSEITIHRPEGDTTIQLLQGDLTAIPDNLAVDILVVSAFRGYYQTLPETLIGALFKAGISVAELAQDKELDLVTQLGCWLSKPLPLAQQKRLNIRSILCFEPAGTVVDAETAVGNLFRGINSFAMDELHNEIAMPVLATGKQQFPLDVMLPTLLDTAIFWLENGLPLRSLKLVLHGDEQVAVGQPIFDKVKQQYALKQQAEAGQISARRALHEIKDLSEGTLGGADLPKMEYALKTMPPARQPGWGPDIELSREFSFEKPAPPKPTTYDYFISYSHKYTAPVQELVNALKARNPDFQIFYDRDSIPAGGLWIKMISDAIQNSRNVVCVLTPEYSQSAVCWDEFQCAYVMEKRKKLNIRTINFRNDADLPPMIAIYSYIDCTEGDLDKLKAAVDQLTQN